MSASLKSTLVLLDTASLGRDRLAPFRSIPCTVARCLCSVHLLWKGTVCLGHDSCGQIRSRPGAPPVDSSVSSLSRARCSVKYDSLPSLASPSWNVRNSIFSPNNVAQRSLARSTTAESQPVNEAMPTTSLQSRSPSSWTLRGRFADIVEAEEKAEASVSADAERRCRLLRRAGRELLRPGLSLLDCSSGVFEYLPLALPGGFDA